jgi:hypothetical protein
MTAADFRGAIEKLLIEGKSRGMTHIDITSGEVHRQVGGYPGRNHRMATCCDTMRSIMKENDSIISEPPKGKGATLVIRYRL